MTTDPAGWTWPSITELEARLGAAFTDAGDRADAEQALGAAVDYAVLNSSIVHARAQADETGPGELVGRGVLDLAVALYERRGSNASDVFADVQPETRTHWRMLLGIGGYARPKIAGGAV